ncbi:MAG TPA: hypothetical protein VIL49_13805, partial [Capillimicrobium sp.]
MRPALALLLAVAAVLVAAGGTAGAVERLRTERFAVATSRAEADDRYVAFMRADGDAQVVDTASGRAAVIDLPEGCAFFRLGGGRLVAPCGPSRAEPTVYRLSTGAPEPVLGWGDVQARAMTTGRLIGVGRIGRRWMAVVGGPAQFFTTSYLSWQTGELIAPEGSSAGEVVTLDAEQPRSPLCAPLQRTPLPRFEASRTDDPFYEYRYDPPWGRQPRRPRRVPRALRDRAVPPTAVHPVRRAAPGRRRRLLRLLQRPRPLPRPALRRHALDPVAARPGGAGRAHADGDLRLGPAPAGRSDRPDAHGHPARRAAALLSYQRARWSSITPKPSASRA